MAKSKETQTPTGSKSSKRTGFNKELKDIVKQSFQPPFRAFTPADKNRKGQRKKDDGEK